MSLAKAQGLIFLFVIVFSFNNVSLAGDVFEGVVEVAEVTSIYDGDTFRANIEGWPRIIGERVPVRINGIDTPELRADCKREKEWARRAKQFTVSALREAESISLKNVRRGKYFRIIADVVYDGEDLGSALVAKGLAVTYSGSGSRFDWCT